jgi:hypothetical protein
MTKGIFKFKANIRDYGKGHFVLISLCHKSQAWRRIRYLNIDGDVEDDDVAIVDFKGPSNPSLISNIDSPSTKTCSSLLTIIVASLH